MKRVKTLSIVVFLLSILGNGVSAVKRGHVDEAEFSPTKGKKQSSKRLQMVEEGETLPLTLSLEEMPDAVLEVISSHLGVRDYVRLRELSHRFLDLLERQKYVYHALILRGIATLSQNYPRQGGLLLLSHQLQDVLEEFKPYDNSEGAFNARAHVAAFSLALGDILADGRPHPELLKDFHEFELDTPQKHRDEFGRELEKYRISQPLTQGIRPPVRMNLIQILRKMDGASLALLATCREDLFTSSMTFYGKMKIIEALSELQGEQIRAFLEHRAGFLDKTSSFHERGRVIRALGAMDFEAIAGVATAIPLLISPRESGFGRVQMIESMARLGLEHLKWIITYREALFVPSASRMATKEWMENLGKLTPEQLQTVGLHGARLFRPGGGIPYRLKRLQELRKLTPEGIRREARL